MADFYIENKEIKIGINNHGAELVSLVEKASGREYMWSGDPKYWGRVSPILFPFVGKLKDQTYCYKGKSYCGIPQHGYARDCEFTLAEKLDDTIWFELCPDESMKENYPFDFLLRVGYRLEGKIVHVMWTVRNDSSEDLPFSIGAHPAFIMPEGSSKNGYYFDLHTNMQVLKSGLIGGKGTLSDTVRTYPLENGKLKITDALFDDDALIIESKDIHTISIQSPEGKAFLQVRFDTPLVGLWSPVGDAPFVCIEPWFGRCDREDYQGDLIQREYGNILSPGHSFNKEYVIELV